MSLAEKLISIVAPVNCLVCDVEGASLCLACYEAEIIPFGERCYGCGRLSPNCKTCQRCRAAGGPRYVWLTTDYHGTASQLITKYKFSHQRVAGRQLAGGMIETIKTFNSDADLKKYNYLVTYIPTATSRVRARGFDHARLLARLLAVELGATYAPCLARIGQNQQIGASRSVRQRQAMTAYKVVNPWLVRGRNILIIDDVVTTGATLSAAAKLLRQAGAKHVDAAAFAKRL